MDGTRHQAPPTNNHGSIGEAFFFRSSPFDRAVVVLVVRQDDHLRQALRGPGGGNEGVETGERAREDEGGKSEWGRVRKEWTEE